MTCPYITTTNVKVSPVSRLECSVNLLKEETLLITEPVSISLKAVGRVTRPQAETFRNPLPIPDS
jgi:hypothetical protein